MENWKEIKSFAYVADAYPAKNYLESEGIDVFLKDEVTTQVLNVVGGVKLMVPEHEEEKALKLLHEGGYSTTEDE